MSQFLNLPLVSLGSKPAFPYLQMETVCFASLWVVRRIRCIKKHFENCKIVWRYKHGYRGSTFVVCSRALSWLKKMRSPYTYVLVNTFAFSEIDCPWRWKILFQKLNALGLLCSYFFKAYVIFALYCNGIY